MSHVLPEPASMIIITLVNSGRKRRLVALPGNVTPTCRIFHFYWQNPRRYWLSARRPKITLPV